MGSPMVRDVLASTLELDLIGPMPGLLKEMERGGQAGDADQLRARDRVAPWSGVRLHRAEQHCRDGEDWILRLQRWPPTP